MATASNVIDIDRDFDPEAGETLDQYRERVLKTMQQPGFGAQSKPATAPAPQVPAGDNATA